MRPKLALTKTAIDAIPFAPGQTLYAFKEPSGLLLVVGKKTRTFAFQTDRGGKTQRIKLGRYLGTKESVDAARASALEKQVDLERGRGLRPTAFLTLRKAMEAYLQDRKTLAPKTRAYTTELFDRHIEDWYDKPLAGITPAMILDRHREVGAKHPTTANDLMRKLRVVYNHATAIDDGLPSNPVRKLSAARAWYPTNRRVDHIHPHKLRDWNLALLDMRALNSVHADLLALILFTGMRRDEACALRWEECDLEAGTIRLSATRTKQRREHIVPLSPQAADILFLREPQKSGWVFPADSASGHVAEPRWALDQVNTIAGTECSVHGLRRTFVSVAEACAISPMQLSGLVGHAAGNITQSYVQHSGKVLKDAALIVGTRLESLCLDGDQ